MSVVENSSSSTEKLKSKAYFCLILTQSNHGKWIFVLDSSSVCPFNLKKKEQKTDCVLFDLLYAVSVDSFPL